MSLGQIGKKEYWIKWIVAALIRAVRTFAQAAAGAFTVGAAFSDINWAAVFSVAGVAAVLSLLTSLGGLPEVPKQTEEQ